jgi:hypothetical protein
LKQFEAIAEKVFVPRLLSRGIPKRMNAGLGGNWFDGKDLENAVKDLLRERKVDEDVAFRQDGEQECKV